MTFINDERLLDLIVEWDEARRRGENHSPEELCPDDPSLQQALRQRIEQRLRLEKSIEPELTNESSELSREALSAASRQLGDLSAADNKLPEHIGRYRRDRLLGRGGFGLVLRHSLIFG